MPGVAGATGAGLGGQARCLELGEDFFGIDFLRHDYFPPPCFAPVTRGRKVVFSAGPAENLRPTLPPAMPSTPKPAAPPVPEPVLTPALRAFCFPFLAFMLLLPLVGALQKLGRPEFFLAEPKYWIFPLQTVLCAGLLAAFWRRYPLHWPKRGGEWAWSLGIAILVLGIWISPQAVFGKAPRLEGFDPNVFPPGSPLYWASLAFRFARLVVVVPLLEEIFWRGFLLRYLIREDFESLPMGSASRFSFAAVTLCFALAHWGPDFWAALATGALYNLIAVRTRSLAACVIAHAVTNLLLGVYIMATGQWGFW